MRVTAIVNLKGGVAKTTTAVNMAYILAHDYSQRVLLIDADSQCNCTEFFGGDPEKSNLAQILRYGADLEHAGTAYCRVQCQSTEYPGVDILPGDASLMDLDLSSVQMGKSNPQVLRWMATALADSYDYMLIDCPPAFNAASAAALVAANDVVIPIKLDAFSLRGMGNLMQQITNMRAINAKLRIAGVLPTMWYKSPEIQSAEKQLKAAELPVFHHIRKSPTVDRMTFQQTPLGICSKTSGARIDYNLFVDEYRKAAHYV